MPHFSRRLIFWITCMVMVGGLIYSRLAFFELPQSQQHTIHFRHHSDVLEGTLLLPKGTSSPPVAILVHGDGAQDRWSNGGYALLSQFLVSKGIAVFSWHKPGIQASQGNWLAQRMSDRAAEAAEAARAVKMHPALTKSRIGFLGFSQAGWVIPQASQLMHTDFIILIGAAINWREQGIYYTGQRLKAEGWSNSAITRAQQNEALKFDTTFTTKSSALPCQSICTRDDFERINALSDAKVDIMQIQSPTLLLMGADDLNVNAVESVATWQNMLPAQTPRCIYQVPHATHGLLKSEWFNYQLIAEWPIWKQGVYLMMARSAYAPSTLDQLADWILKQKCDIKT